MSRLPLIAALAFPLFGMALPAEAALSMPLDVPEPASALLLGLPALALALRRARAVNGPASSGPGCEARLSSAASTPVRDRSGVR